MKKLGVQFVIGIFLVTSGILIVTKSAKFPQNLPANLVSSPAPIETSSLKAESVRITRVVDGDTVVLSNGTRLRYIGMDTPERGKCYFEQARTANENLVLNKIVRLEKDVTETDKYARLLRYVWVNSPNGEVMVNEQLVKDGFAKIFTYPPDVKYKDRFVAAQERARENNKGLWSSSACDVKPSPQSSRDAGASATVQGANTKVQTNFSVQADNKDCSDFKTRQEAQAFFLAHGGPSQDLYKLDRDGDGIACESLP